MGALAALAVAAGLTGCGTIAVEDETGRVHYVIIGFGIVSVERNAADPHGTVVEASSIGLTFSRLPEPAVTLGYSHTMTFTVPNDFAYVRERPPVGKQYPDGVEAVTLEPGLSAAN